MKGRILTMIVTAVAMVAMAACSATRTTRSTGETVDDATVTAKVKTALARDPSTSAYKIDVESYRGEVQLNGFVETADMKSAATRVAKSVDGVKKVSNTSTALSPTMNPALPDARPPGFAIAAKTPFATGTSVKLSSGFAVAIVA